LLAPGNLQTWFGTRFGTIWLGRGLLLALTHFHLSLFMDVRHGRAELRGWEWWAGLLLALTLALTSSLISHSAALGENMLRSVLIDFAHITAATIWIGSVLFLAVSLWQMRELPRDTRSWFNLSLILNFSAIAALSVGILTVSGIYLGWTHINGWTKLVSTAYGLILADKLGMALLVFILAGYNLQFLKPRLTAAYEDPENTTSGKPMRAFRRIVTAEGGVLLLILLATGLLTDIQRGLDAPPLADPPGRTVVTQEAEGLNVEMVIEPALVGQNSFEIYITDENGDPATDLDEVSMSLHLPGTIDGGRIRRTGAGAGGGLPAGRELHQPVWRLAGGGGDPAPGFV
jgi:copper transport protein